VLEDAALRLLRAEPVAAVRLIGLRLSNWAPRGPPPGQRALDGLLAAAGGGGEHGGEPGAGRASPPPPLQPPPPPPPAKPAAPSTTWACHVCTFADTPAHSLRCGVCDALRGARPGDLVASAPAPAAAAVTAVAAPPAAKKARKGGSAARGGGSKPLIALFAKRAGGSGR